MKTAATTRTLSLLFVSAILGAGCGPDDEHDHQHDTEDEALLWESAYLEGKADSATCSGVRVPDRKGFEKRVALTFDDGPNPETTPKLLDYLKSAGIEATFFVNGKQLRRRSARAILERIVNEGHILANHSTSHGNMRHMGVDEVRTEIAETDKYIGEFTNPRYFRFPYGSASCTATEEVSAAGYITTGWHVDSADWCYASKGRGGVGVCNYEVVVPNAGHATDMVANVMAQTRRNGGGVILFHDVHRFTVDAIPRVVESLRAEGYTFTNLDDTETFPLLNGAAITPTPTPVPVPEPTPEPEPAVDDQWPVRNQSRPFIGNDCAQDAQCGFRVGSTYGSCKKKRAFFSDEGLCSMPCAGLCPDQAGQPSTFCADLGASGGSCLGQCRTDADCSSGTECVAVNRYVGQSRVTARVAKVCVYSTWLR